MTLRKGKEDLIVRTPQGNVTIEVSPITKNRSRVIVRAPKSIEIGRSKHPQEASYDDAV